MTGGLVWKPWACFPGEMITGQRIDEYVTRIAEVKAALEKQGWTPIRHDEWSSPLGDTIRFSYAHLEFRVYTNYIGVDRRPETHVIHVRNADQAHVPTVKEILNDILDINLAAWNPRHAAYQAATGSNGVASQPQA